jgi:integrase
MQHVLSGKVRGELTCSLIAGFHLQKMSSCATWRMRYRDHNNQQKIIKLGTYVDGKIDRVESAELALKYRQQILDGNQPIVGKDSHRSTSPLSSKRKGCTLGQYLLGPYTVHQSTKANAGKHTIDMIAKHFKQWVHLTLASIDGSDLQAWHAHKQKSALSHATILRAFGAFRTMMRHAVKHGVIEFDPSHKFQLQTPAPHPQNTQAPSLQVNPRRLLSKQELTAIQSGIAQYKSKLIAQRSNSISHGKRQLPSLKGLTHPHWFFPFLRLAAYTGLRSGDLYSLTWQELNLAKKSLTKAPNKTKHYKDPIKVELPLDDSIMQIMSAWYQQQGSPRSGLVFASKATDKQMDKKAHIRHWKKILVLGQVGLELDFGFLRDHYIARLISANMPLYSVAKLAGHKTTNVLQQLYGHLAPNVSSSVLLLSAEDFDELPKQYSLGF